MNNKCSDVDCRYPDCTCWQDKHSQSVERIYELEAERDEADKRIAELEEELDICMKMGKDVCDSRNEYKAERDRLREALQEIANKELSGWATRTGLPPYDVQSCINIAKIALKEIDT